MTVYKAIQAVAAEICETGIAKDRTNSSQGAGYRFRGIDDVYNAVGRILAKHGLSVLPRVLSRESVERKSSTGKALFYVTLEVEFDLCSADGSKHTIKVFGEAMDSSDKATNKAMSAAYKYALIQTFCIPTEGDNDADAKTIDVQAAAQDDPAPAPSEAEIEASYETFGRQLYRELKMAARTGSASLAAAYESVPKSRFKARFWTEYAPDLKAFAESMDDIQV